MTHLEIDFETRSAVDLKKHGVYVYAENPYTSVEIASYTFDEAKTIRRWKRGQPCPEDIRRHIEADGKIVAHNAQFERVMMQYVLQREEYAWPYPDTSQFVCAMVTARALNLPPSLDELSKAMGSTTEKDMSGNRLMIQMCKPRKPKKGEDPTKIHWYGYGDPEMEERQHKYCDDDVRAEAFNFKKCVKLKDTEQKLYSLDQIINSRGIRLDVTSAEAAIRIIEASKSDTDAAIRDLTGGEVTSVTQVSKIVRWLNENGYPELDSIASHIIQELISRDDTPCNVRELLELRASGGSAAILKIRAMLARASKDGRIRGSFVMNGAGTGRWSSVGVQFQNMLRGRKVYGSLNKRTVYKAIQTGNPHILRHLYGGIVGNPPKLVGDALRGFLMASEGHFLRVADYSNIEGRVNAWCAGEEWKLRAFRDVDSGIGHDLYLLAAAGIYNKPVESYDKNSPERQIGKVAELALGYQGGVAAFSAMAKGYGLDMATAFPAFEKTTEPGDLEKAIKKYEKNKTAKLFGADQMTMEAWVASDLTKIGWRKKNCAISESWSSYEDAVMRAVQNPGQITQTLRVKYIVSRGFLFCQLPSGRCLAYGSPQIDKMRMPWAEMSEEEFENLSPEQKENLTDKEAVRDGVTAMAVHPVTKKWTRRALYGGLLCENIVQAIARDILAEAMFRLEGAGYKIIGHVHDEILSENKIGSGSLREYEDLMAILPDWATGLPVAVEGWEGKRFRK